jgi:hypothetical protein
LDEADALFSRLRQSSVEDYMDLGRLGHAIVLGLQNQAVESNQAVLDLWKQKNWRLDRPRQSRLLAENPQLAQWLARALDYNAKNLPKDAVFPIDLMPLRTPWRGALQRAATEKGPGKK